MTRPNHSLDRIVGQGFREEKSPAWGARQPRTGRRRQNPGATPLPGHPLYRVLSSSERLIRLPAASEDHATSDRRSRHSLASLGRSTAPDPPTTLRATTRELGGPGLGPMPGPTNSQDRGYSRQAPGKTLVSRSSRGRARLDPGRERDAGHPIPTLSRAGRTSPGRQASRPHFPWCASLVQVRKSLIFPKCVADRHGLTTILARSCSYSLHVEIKKSSNNLLLLTFRKRDAYSITLGLYPGAILAH
jgi:hypothetical protein